MDIPYEWRRWDCPDPTTCPARDVSGHSATYCPYAVGVRDGRTEWR